MSGEAEELAMQELRMYFRPEFLNRLDEIILFQPLSRESMKGIIRLIMDDLNQRLQDRELQAELTPEAEHWIIDQAYDPLYGARPLKRYIQKHVETLSARLILEDQTSAGDRILIDVADEMLTAQVVSGIS